MQISLHFIIYFCLVKWGNSSIADSLIICIYNFYIRNKCLEYSLLIIESFTCISKSDGSQNSFINLILYTYVYPKPIISFFAGYSPKKKKSNIRQSLGLAILSLWNFFLSKGNGENQVRGVRNVKSHEPKCKYLKEKRSYTSKFTSVSLRIWSISW